MKALHQAGITAVRYHKEWAHPDASLRSQYRAIENKFKGGVKRVDVEDPDDPDWIYPKKTQQTESRETTEAEKET